MHSIYNFHFLDTISKQLNEELKALGESMLHPEAVAALSGYQRLNNAAQGVYVLYYAEAPVYLGKAEDVAERIGQHLRKLLGRRNIDPDQIGYKCILLDKSMSTAANESILIEMFRKDHSGMWNGKGFGPKDPGKERDGTKPSWFDENHPIRLDLPVGGIDEPMPLLALCLKLKAQLPYVFRFDLEDRGADVIDPSGIDKTPLAMLEAIVKHLGSGWRGAMLSFGMVIYKNQKAYPYATIVEP